MKSLTSLFGITARFGRPFLVALLAPLAAIAFGSCKTVVHTPLFPPPPGAAHLTPKMSEGLARVLSLLITKGGERQIAVKDVCATPDMLSESRQKFLRSIHSSAQEICLRTKWRDHLGDSYLYDNLSRQISRLPSPCAGHYVPVRVEKADPYYNADFFVEIDAGGTALDFTVTLATGKVTYLGNAVPVEPAPENPHRRMLRF